MINYYKLDQHRNPIPCKDIREWSEWFERSSQPGPDCRVVTLTKGGAGGGDVEVSTVFLGLDHNFMADGPPLLFETMVFGGEHDGLQERCATWQEAVAQHDRICGLAFGRGRKLNLGPLP